MSLHNSSVLIRISSIETPLSIAANIAPPAPTPSFTDPLV